MALTVPPLTPALSPQARLGELASKRGRIRKRMRLEREFRSQPLRRRPLSHGERDRVRGVSAV